MSQTLNYTSYAWLAFASYVLAPSMSQKLLPASCVHTFSRYALSDHTVYLFFAVFM